MAGRVLSATAVVRTLENGVYVGEGVFFPELLACEGKRQRLTALLRGAFVYLAERDPGFAVHRRTLGEGAKLKAVRVEMKPAAESVAWEEPVELEFDVAYWRHGDEGWIAFVPAVGIEVIASTEPKLWEKIPREIRHALQRSKAANSLHALAMLQRDEETELETVEIVVGIKSPKERELALLAAAEEKAKPVIEQVGVKLDEQSSAEGVYEVDEEVAQLAEVLGGGRPRSVLLVGPSGVGKTAIVQELVRKRRQVGFNRVPFWSTSGSRLVAGMSGFGMWQERCQKLIREARKAGAILHLGNLVELMEVGKGEMVGQGIASFLRPYIGRGDVITIAECTAEQLPVIERADAHLLEAFVQIRVEEPTVERGKKILRQAADGIGMYSIADEAIDTLDRLHRRYASYSAYPGRPLRFLRNLLHDWKTDEARRRKQVRAREVTEAFARETGLPGFMLDAQVKLDLEGSRKWFGERVIGQSEAVDLVTDLLATVKAALNRPRRPIASLLFIGPTGVGKTEMAKALAEFFFNDRNRLARFDMSEYNNPAAVARLVGGTFAQEGLLTAKVREQPFSVVLLDEFEKADASFFDLLLQVLGDGRLTDGVGRVADFSNAIVVMTSNLGAESYRQTPFGLSREERRDARSHFVEAVREFLRPEMYNRLDRVVPFLPLDEETVLGIVKRELSLLGRRDGLRLRPIEVTYGAEVAPWLARKGFDPLYGARPLKRALERQVLAPLADGVNGYPTETKLVADVTASEREGVRVTVKAATVGSRQMQGAASGTWAGLAGRCALLRRQLQALERCSAVMSLRNEVFALQRRREIRDRTTKRKRRVSFDPQIDQRLQRLEEVDAQVRAAIAEAVAVEDAVLGVIYDAAEADEYLLWRRLAGVDLFKLLLRVYCLRHPRPDEVMIAMFSVDQQALITLASAYYQLVMQGEQAEITMWWYEHPTFQKRAMEKADKFFANPNARAVGIAMRVRAAGAVPRFIGEKGIHELAIGNESARVSVETAAEWESYLPGANAHVVPHGEAQRVYRLNQLVIEERSPRREFRWTGRKMTEALSEAIEERLHAELFGLIGE